MNIGIVGATSNIAGKAYLPVYAALQDQHDFVIYSRDLKKAEALRCRYQFTAATSDLAELEACKLVMIHAATDQHYFLAKHFLSAGVSVFMDKPISENLAESEELLQLADAKNLLFIIGFNRRFVPLVEKLKRVTDKNFIKVSKNLISDAGDATYKLYDVFIHPLDTLIYLLDDAIIHRQQTIKRDEKGRLLQMTLLLETATTTGLATMNLVSGAYSEAFEVESAKATHRLSDLTAYDVKSGMTKEVFAVNGWQSAPSNRGFEPMIRATFDAVSRLDGSNRDALLRMLKQDKVLLSHQIINNLLEDLK
jgi:virulence factor